MNIIQDYWSGQPQYGVTWERFSWFRDDVRTSSSIGSKLIIKGKALYPTVSRNNRKYLETELIRAARTLAGKPIDVNHAYDFWLMRKKDAELKGKKFDETPPRFVGNVLDAEYEDGAIEYVAQISDPMYVMKLKDRESMEPGDYYDKWGREPIHGVSISANYRYPDPDQKLKTPRGIKFVRLTLVEDPETPGVKKTTIKVQETYRIKERSLEETMIVGAMINDVAPMMMENYVNEVMQYFKPTLNYEAHDPRSIYNFGDLHTVRETEEPAQIGEPFADYKNHADCVAQNQSKADPAAYCATIQRQAESLAYHKRRSEIMTEKQILLTATEVVGWLDHTEKDPDKGLLEKVLETYLAEVDLTVDDVTKKLEDLDKKLENTWDTPRFEEPTKAERKAEQAEYRRKERERLIIRAEIDAWNDVLKALIRKRVGIPTESQSQVSVLDELLSDSQRMNREQLRLALMKERKKI